VLLLFMSCCINERLMKRTSKKKTGAKQKAEAAEPAETPASQEPLEKVLERCREEAKGRLEKITKKMGDKAESGSCQHAKFVFELAQSGLKTAPAEEEEDSLAAVLMRELETPGAAPAEEEAPA
jgi:hypothetical protein